MEAKFFKEQKPGIIISELFFGKPTHLRLKNLSILLNRHLPSVYRNIISNAKPPTRIFVFSKYTNYPGWDKIDNKYVAAELNSAKKKYPENIVDKFESYNGLSANEILVRILIDMGIEEDNIFPKTEYAPLFTNIKRIYDGQK